MGASTKSESSVFVTPTIREFKGTMCKESNMSHYKSNYEDTTKIKITLLSSTGTGDGQFQSMKAAARSYIRCGSWTIIIM